MGIPQADSFVPINPLAQGASTAEACRRIAVSEQTYYRWRKEYGGLKTDQARRMKDLEKENQRLRRDCQEFRVWAGIMRKKETPYASTQGAGDPG
jgi:transposase-like protein